MNILEDRIFIRNLPENAGPDSYPALLFQCDNGCILFVKKEAEGAHVWLMRLNIISIIGARMELITSLIRRHIVTIELATNPQSHLLDNSAF